MKKFAWGMAILAVTVAVGQAPAPFWVGTPTGPLTGCGTPLVGTNLLCSVTDGYYVSISGAAYVKINAASGVATFNGRSGNVLPAQGDYAYSQLSGLPTSFTCTSGNVGNAGSSGAGCTFK